MVPNVYTHSQVGLGTFETMQDCRLLLLRYLAATTSSFVVIVVCLFLFFVFSMSCGNGVGKASRTGTMNFLIFNPVPMSPTAFQLKTE